MDSRQNIQSISNNLDLTILRHIKPELMLGYYIEILFIVSQIQNASKIIYNAICLYYIFKSCLMVNNKNIYGGDPDFFLYNY